MPDPLDSAAPITAAVGLPDSLEPADPDLVEALRRTNLYRKRHQVSASATSCHKSAVLLCVRSCNYSTGLYNSPVLTFECIFGCKSLYDQALAIELMLWFAVSEAHQATTPMIDHMALLPPLP